MNCSEDLCEAVETVARGLCSKHYQQARKAGHLAAHDKRQWSALTLAERFARIGWTENANGCWIWNGSCNARGYGKISTGRRNSSGQSGALIASRVSWEVHVGPIAEGLVVCHRCDNPPCVNPAHLFVGTRRDNNVDMAHKLRSVNGERRPQCKLTDAEVAEIRRAYVETGVTQRELAARFRVSQSTISLIVSNRRRQHVTRPH